MTSGNSKDTNSGKLRVLSYNLSIAPFWCGAFRQERVDSFVSLVDGYDVILLQEVYPSSIFPYALQRFLCYQKRLLEGLRAKGFPHYVVSRQPSYNTMLRYNIMSNNGLVIASRYPIGRHGSHTFRRSFREKNSFTYGCLFAEIECPSKDGGPCAPVVFFNVHLRPSTSSYNPQHRSAEKFVHLVMNELSKEASEGLPSSYQRKKAVEVQNWLPFVIAGDLNVQGADLLSRMPSSEFLSFISEFDPLSKMQNVLFSKQSENSDRWYIPATKSPQPFFSCESSFESTSAAPLRTDYFFVSHGTTVLCERIEKFVIGRRPYVYLSDHYGIDVTLKIPPTLTRKAQPGKKLERLVLPSSEDVEEAVSESSKLSFGVYAFPFVTAIIFLALSLYFSSIYLFIAFVALVSAVKGLRSTISSLPSTPQFGKVTEAVMAGKASVELIKRSKGRKNPSSTSSLSAMWQNVVSLYGDQPCITSCLNLSSTTLLYAQVNERVQLFGQGLFSLGLQAGERIGLLCSSCCDGLIFDLVCLRYGFSSVSLSGKGDIIKDVLDENNIRYVCSTANKIYSLLSSRSRSLESIICMDAIPLDADAAMAKDLNISILSSSSLRDTGRRFKRKFPEVEKDSTVWTYAMNNIATSNFASIRPITHQDLLRDLENLKLGGVLPAESFYYSSERDRSVFFSSSGTLFPRIFALGILFSGGCIATTEGCRFEDACQVVKPTIIAAQPELFRQSLLQMKRDFMSYPKLFRIFYKSIYNFCSSLIHAKNQDCSLLRNYFFQSFREQLGGSVEKIILFTSQETTPFDLLEHMTVCYSPCVREVFYLNHCGMCAVDGIPVPECRISLRTIAAEDALSDNYGIGELILRIRGEKHKTGIAARWDKRRCLCLLDSAEGILWPVDYQYAIAVQLERIFALSRYVNDVFVYCQPGQPVVAVVFPNKDTVEYAWKYSSPSSVDSPFGWTELAAFGKTCILEDLISIGKQHSLHVSQLPAFIHLHPHAFYGHASFLNPFGMPCRPRMTAYFSFLSSKFYNTSPVSPSVANFNFQEAMSDGDACESVADSSSLLSLTVPFTIDIGGTFAKIAYIMPPGYSNQESSPILLHEHSSLSNTLGLRAFKFFRNEGEGEEELRTQPMSRVGMISFMKVPTAKITELAEYVQSLRALQKYKKEYTSSIRATGGGAFKYSHIAKEVLGASFAVVKEMDAVVKGLNLIIQFSPSSIFTVNPTTGLRLPHQLHSSTSEFSPYPFLLINIGSGISFVKCTGPDGSHIRVGGSPIGGATFWGLTRILTNLTSWDEVLEIMRLDGPGDNKNVDLLVGDIYGFNAKDLPAMLSSETVASCFGKFGVQQQVRKNFHSTSSSLSECDLPSASRPTDISDFPSNSVGRNDYSSIDVVRSLLNMLSGNVTQLAYLHSNIHGVKNIFFAGGLVRENQIMWRLISASLQYWSSGECAAHFLEHDGYLGALGCSVL